MHVLLKDRAYVRALHGNVRLVASLTPMEKDALGPIGMQNRRILFGSHKHDPHFSNVGCASRQVPAFGLLVSYSCLSG
jgi:hypothetical protein